MLQRIAFTLIGLVIFRYCACQNYNPQRLQKTVLPSYANLNLAVFDFDNDGFDDLLVGANNYSSTERTPLRILINQRNGIFADKTSQFLSGDARSSYPISTIADFNKDGVLDFAIFGQGNVELGQDPAGGFYGEEAFMLLSTSRTHWTVDSNLADGYQSAHPENHRDLHSKFVLSADIDNDGDIDIFAEAGGGYKTILSHFYINDGTGHFKVDKVETRMAQSLLDGGPSVNNRWRFQVHNFTDMNNDGYVDLIMGQLRRVENNQEGLHSLVVLNDKTGKFSSTNAYKLPYPNWNDGYTYTKKILTYDLDNDLDNDIIISHERGTNNTLNDGNTGNYFQFLINNGDNTYFDATNQYITNTSEMLQAQNSYGANSNTSKSTQFIDVNEDGFPDIVLTGNSTPVGAHNPLVFLNNGSNVFKGIDYMLITKGMTYFGEDSAPIDINKDGVIDFISSDLMSGTDGVYNTGDEYSELFPIYGVRDYPLTNNSTIGSCDVQAGDVHITTSPDPGVTHYRIDNITGGKLHRIDNSAEIINGTMVPTSVAISGFSISPTAYFKGPAYFHLQGSTSVSPAGVTGSRYIADFTIVNNYLSGHAGADVSGCEGTKGGIVGTVPVSSFSYSWSPVIGISNATAANPAVSFLQPPGDYTYTLSAMKSGCISTDEVKVTILQNPPKSGISLINSGTLKASITQPYYEWRLEANMLEGLNTQMISFSNSGKYYVRSRSSTGCFSEWSEAFEVGPIVTAVDDFNPEIKVYPNPVKDKLYINWGTDGRGNITIVSITGQVIQSEVLTTNDEAIDLKTLSQGIYLLYAVSATRSDYFKLMVLK